MPAHTQTHTLHMKMKGKKISVRAHVDKGMESKFNF